MERSHYLQQMKTIMKYIMSSSYEIGFKLYQNINFYNTKHYNFNIIYKIPVKNIYYRFI